MAKIKKDSFRTVYLPLDEYQQEESNDEYDDEKILTGEMNNEIAKVTTPVDSAVIKTEEINDHHLLSKISLSIYKFD